MPDLPFNHIGFRLFLSEGKLMGARCAQCGEVYLPPRSMCARCYGNRMEWVELSGEGVVMGFTHIHVGLPVMAAGGFNRDRPYCSGVVRLKEGPAISAQLVGKSNDQPGEVWVGMPARAVFLKRGEEVVLAFAVDGEAPGEQNKSGGQLL